MKQNNATRRLGEQLREKLGYILLFEISDPRLDLVTITGVEVSIDRSFARVFVTCDGDRYEEVLEALASTKGRVRSLLARTLDWRGRADRAGARERPRDALRRKGRGRVSRPERGSGRGRCGCV